eukprot:gene13632-19510_t
MADIKKKIKPGAIEVHPEELALVVNFEVQEVQTLPNGSSQVVSKKQDSKKITVKSLTSKTNLTDLAAEIVEKCKLIHPSKVAFVEELLQALLNRNQSNEVAPSTRDKDASSKNARAAAAQAQKERRRANQETDASFKNARAAAAQAQKERRRANQETGVSGIVFGMGL